MTARSGIIGTGFMGDVHARAVRSAGGVVAAVAGSTRDKSAAAAARWNARAVDDVIDADDVDVVHVCTPNATHAALALRALAAGKHVICEKPLALDAVSTRELADAAAAAGVVAAVPFVYRFYPTVRDARDRVRRDEAGPLRLLHGSYLQDWLADSADTNWRVDPARGGASRAFADIGVHWCDLVEFVTGHRIVRVSARLLTAYPGRGGTEDAATVQFETDRDAIGSVVVSQITHGRKNRLWFSLDGAKASLSFDQELPDSLWIGGRDHNAVVRRGTAANRYDVLPPGHPQGYQDCFTAFVADVYAAVAGAPPDGLPTFADGHRAALVTAAVLDSAKTGSWTEVR